MSNILIILLSIGVCLTTGQWMPYMEPQTMSPFAHPMPDELIVSKDSSNKIPIILLLKPKRAKSLSADTSSESVERHQTTADNSMSLNEWMEMPHINSDSMAIPQTHANQQMSAEYDMSEEPDQEASEGDEVTLKGRGGDQIKWPQALTGKKDGLTSEQLASISHLFPKLAAMGASNSDMSEVDNKNTGALFEDALKKFTNNLTDLEHRNNEDSDKNSDEEGELKNSSESAIDSQNSGISEDLKSESNDKNENSDEYKHSFSAEQRDINLKLSPQKSRPLINERNRIKIPVKSELNDHRTNTGTQAMVSDLQKGWVPIKNKYQAKRQRPTKQPSVHRTETHLLHFPSDPSSLSGEYLYHNTDRNLFGMPEILNTITSTETPTHLFRPRHYPHSYIPYDTKQTISHLPFHNSPYSSYLTDTTLLEMNADANKPQHTEPNKMGEDAAIADKVKDVIEKNEQMIDNKHILGEKHTSVVDGKHAMHGLSGEDLLGHHITCCDILNGQHFGGHTPHGLHHPFHHTVVHEEIKPVFDDDKAITTMGVHETSHKGPEYPLQFGNSYGNSFGSKFGIYPGLSQAINHKKHCLHSFPSYPRTSWPPQVYRRPVYRPKLFYKPLFFG